jgi:glycosyltransferase involved in cell wall biosynthesis
MPSGEPAFSVVIPTYGRPGLVQRCLGALAAIDPPDGGFEVIIIDDGSPERIEPVVSSFEDRLDVRVYRQRNAGPATARNVGVRKANGIHVAFLDDDCLPEVGWLRELEAKARNEPTCAAGGRMVSAPTDSIYSIASNLLIAYLYDYYNASEGARFFATANLMCPRQAFLDFGGFDESFRIAAAEDRDFCDRWVEAGLPLRSVGDAVVHHAPRLGFRRFLRQHFNYGRGANHLHAARSRRGLSRPRLEPLRFYWRLLAAPGHDGLGRNRLALCSLMLITQIAYLFGYLSEKIVGQSARRTGPRQPLDPEPEEEGVTSA